LRGDFGERAFRHDDELGLRATGGDSKHTLAHFPRAHFFADGFDFAGKLEAGNVLRKTGRRGIFSLALKNVGAIQSRRAHAHSHAIGRGVFRRIDFPDFQNLRSAGSGDHNSAHLGTRHMVQE
jgi:hypothetical protein